jgi:hypothetical protein
MRQKRNAYSFGRKTMKKRNGLEDLDIYKRKILKQMLKK